MAAATELNTLIPAESGEYERLVQSGKKFDDYLPPLISVPLTDMEPLIKLYIKWVKSTRELSIGGGNKVRAPPLAVTTRTNLFVFFPSVDGAQPPHVPEACVALWSEMMTMVLKAIVELNLDPLQIAVVGKEPGPLLADAPEDVVGVKLLYTVTGCDVVQTHRKLFDMITGNLHVRDDKYPTISGLPKAKQEDKDYLDLLTSSVVCAVLEKVRSQLEHGIRDDTAFGDEKHSGRSKQRLDIADVFNETVFRLGFKPACTFNSTIERLALMATEVGADQTLPLTAVDELCEMGVDAGREQVLPCLLARAFLEASVGAPLQSALLISALAGERVLEHAQGIAAKVNRTNVHEAGLNPTADIAKVKDHNLSMINGAAHFTESTTISIVCDYFLFIGANLERILEIAHEEELREKGIFCLAKGLKLGVKQVLKDINVKTKQRANSVYEYCRSKYVEYHKGPEAKRASKTIERLAVVCGFLATELTRTGGPYQDTLVTIQGMATGKINNSSDVNLAINTLAHAASDLIKCRAELVSIIGAC